MLSRLAILLILPLLLAGCGSTILYVIEKQDFFEVKPGVTVMSDRHGYFLSDLYMTKVVEAKVKRSN